MLAHQPVRNSNSSSSSCQRTGTCPGPPTPARENNSRSLQFAPILVLYHGGAPTPAQVRLQIHDPGAAAPAREKKSLFRPIRVLLEFQLIFINSLFLPIRSSCTRYNSRFPPNPTFLLRSSTSRYKSWRFLQFVFLCNSSS